MSPTIWSILSDTFYQGDDGRSISVDPRVNSGVYLGSPFVSGGGGRVFAPTPPPKPQPLNLQPKPQPLNLQPKPQPLNLQPKSSNTAGLGTANNYGGDFGGLKGGLTRQGPLPSSLNPLPNLKGISPRGVGADPIGKNLPSRQRSGQPSREIIDLADKLRGGSGSKGSKSTPGTPKAQPAPARERLPFAEPSAPKPSALKPAPKPESLPSQPTRQPLPFKDPERPKGQPVRRDPRNPRNSQPSGSKPPLGPENPNQPKPGWGRGQPKNLSPLFDGFTYQPTIRVGPTINNGNREAIFLGPPSPGGLTFLYDQFIASDDAIAVYDIYARHKNENGDFVDSMVRRVAVPVGTIPEYGIIAIRCVDCPEPKTIPIPEREGINPPVNKPINGSPLGWKEPNPWASPFPFPAPLPQPNTPPIPKPEQPPKKEGQRDQDKNPGGIPQRRRDQEPKRRPSPIPSPTPGGSTGSKPNTEQPNPVDFSPQPTPSNTPNPDFNPTIRPAPELKPNPPTSGPKPQQNPNPDFNPPKPNINPIPNPPITPPSPKVDDDKKPKTKEPIPVVQFPPFPVAPKLNSGNACKTADPCMQSISSGVDDANSKAADNGKKLKDIADIVDKVAQIADLALLGLINDKLGPKVEGGLSGQGSRIFRAVQSVQQTAGAIQEKLGKFAKWARLGQLVSVLTLITTLHNALMLSRNVGETLLSMLSNGLAVFGIKDDNNNPYDLSSLIGSTVESTVKATIGTENYTNLSDGFKKANRIYQAAANLGNSIQSLRFSVTSALETIGGWNARIGNALKRSGVVNESSYAWMNPNPNFDNKFTRALETVENTVSQIDSVASEILSAQETVTQIASQKDELAKSLGLGTEKAQTDNKEQKDKAIAAKTASAAPNIEATDLNKPGV